MHVAPTAKTRRRACQQHRFAVGVAEQHRAVGEVGGGDPLARSGPFSSVGALMDGFERSVRGGEGADIACAFSPARRARRNRDVFRSSFHESVCLVLRPSGWPSPLQPAFATRGFEVRLQDAHSLTRRTAEQGYQRAARLCVGGYVIRNSGATAMGFTPNGTGSVSSRVHLLVSCKADLAAASPEPEPEKSEDEQALRARIGRRQTSRTTTPGSRPTGSGSTRSRLAATSWPCAESSRRTSGPASATAIGRTMRRLATPCSRGLIRAIGIGSTACSSRPQ